MNYRIRDSAKGFRNILFLLPITLFTIFIFSGGNLLAQAQSAGSGYQLLAPIDGIPSASPTLVEYMKGLFVAVIGLAIVLAVIELVIGGIEYVAAAIPSAKEDAKKRIGGAVGGLLLILLSWILLDTLNPKLLNVGLNLTPVGGGAPTGTTPGASPSPPPPGTGGAGVGPGTARDIRSTFTKVSTQYSAQIQAACAGKTIPNCESVMAGVIAQESGGVTSITSPAGAVGIMQIMPAGGGQNCASTDSVCIQGQINVGVNQLQKNYNRFGTLPNMLAAYNSGASTIPGTSASGRNSAMVASADCPGLFAWQCSINPGGLVETQDYVATICGVARCL